MSRDRLVVLSVFLVSGAGLIFEITLTRLFSLFFQYHYAFLAVSLAVLGLSLGAAWGRFLPPPPSDRAARRRIIHVLLALSLAFPLVAAVIAWLPSAESILPRALAALVPFILIGLFAALVFERFSAYSGMLYGADLTGAAVGVAVVLGLLNVWSAFSIVLLLGGSVGVLALILVYAGEDDTRPNRRDRAAAGLVCAAGVGLFVLNLAAGVIDFDPARLETAPRDKTMLAVLNDPVQDGRIIYTRWSPFARVDVVETNDPTARYVFTDGGAGSYMLRFDGDLDAVEYYKDAVEYLPFAVSPVDNTLIIGAGGGKDVVLALLAGAGQITAVEVNPAVIRATRRYGGYNGHILDLPQVDLVEGDARTFIERTDAAYDLIYLNLVYTQAAEPTGQVLVENYIFTWQAFKTYLERLKPGGHLAVVSHNALEASRAALTALRALAALHIPPAEGLDHIALWMLPDPDATLRTSVLIVGRDPLSAQTLDDLETLARLEGMSSLFMPGGSELVFRPLRNGMSLDRFVEDDADYDLSPTEDDRPYFFHLDFGLPRPVQSALATTAFLAAGLAVISLLVITPTKAEGGFRRWGAMNLYAALIGAGFMLVEVPLIQRFQLLTGYPILSLAVVLSALLLAGGLGSLGSQRWPDAGLFRRVSAAAVWIAVLVLAYRFVLPPLVEAVLGAPVIGRVLTAAALTALVGAPMGIPFPSLLRLAGRYDQRVALLWAINGAFSVVGSTLAVALSMTWGFSTALTAGAGLYLLLAGLAWGLERTTR